MSDEEIGQPEQEALQLDVDEQDPESGDTGEEEYDRPPAISLSLEDLV